MEYTLCAVVGGIVSCNPHGTHSLHTQLCHHHYQYFLPIRTHSLTHYLLSSVIYVSLRLIVKEKLIRNVSQRERATFSRFP